MNFLAAKSKTRQLQDQFPWEQKATDLAHFVVNNDITSQLHISKWRHCQLKQGSIKEVTIFSQRRLDRDDRTEWRTILHMHLWFVRLGNWHLSKERTPVHRDNIDASLPNLDIQTVIQFDYPKAGRSRKTLRITTTTADSFTRVPKFIPASYLIGLFSSISQALSDTRFAPVYLLNTRILRENGIEVLIGPFSTFSTFVLSLAT